LNTHIIKLTLGFETRVFSEKSFLFCQLGFLFVW
jgi:hypothetical protein